MDVRRGVLRCSSRKLRSSSFVELVAVDKREDIHTHTHTKSEADSLVPPEYICHHNYKEKDRNTH